MNAHPRRIFFNPLKNIPLLFDVVLFPGRRGLRKWRDDQIECIVDGSGKMSIPNVTGIPSSGKEFEIFPAKRNGGVISLGKQTIE